MKRFISSLFSLALAALAAPLAFAQDAASGNYGLDKTNEVAKLPTSNSADIPTLLGKTLGTVLGFTGTIFFILVVYAGLMWMTAAGNEDRIKKAKQILIAAVIGLIIVLSAYAITTYIGNALG